MEALYTLLKFKGNLSTAYHPQMDSQTEWFNALVEQYLWLYTNHPQNDWVEWLALTEFAHNQNTSATGFSPFMLNYGQQPNIQGEHRKQVWNESTKEFAEMMKGTFKLAKELLKHASSDMKKYYNWKTRPEWAYEKGDQVLLEGTNIHSDWLSKKLDDKWYGPFKVVEKVGKSAYKLKLDPKWWGVHPVFHESLLHPYSTPSFPSQKSSHLHPWIWFKESKNRRLKKCSHPRSAKGTLNILSLGRVSHWKKTNGLLPQSWKCSRHHQRLPLDASHCSSTTENPLTSL